MAQKSSATSANETLISNLESQLNRLVEQLKDLEECKWVNRLLDSVSFAGIRNWRSLNDDAHMLDIALEIFIDLLDGFVRRCDLDEDEYQSMKDETVDQIKEFTETLDRMNKGDTTLTSTFSSMRQVSRARSAHFTFDSIRLSHLHLLIRPSEKPSRTRSTPSRWLGCLATKAPTTWHNS